VANSLDGTVSRIDPGTNSATALVPTGDGPDAVAVGARGVWVCNQFGADVVRVDPRTNQVTKRVSVRSPPLGLATSGDAVRRRP
jgi:YVTN family beta-propeller protein